MTQITDPDHGKGFSCRTEPPELPAIGTPAVQRTQASARRFALTPLSILLAAGAAFADASAVYAGSYKFDQRRTEVRFTYVMAYATYHGRFSKVSGALDYDRNAPARSRVNATIAAASLSTGEAVVDDALKGTDFFNVAAAPEITFKSLEVRPESERSAEMVGEVTVNGITKPVTFAVTLEPHDDPALKYDKGSHRFVAKTRIQRSAFNMTAYKALVDDNIELEIDAIVRPR